MKLSPSIIALGALACTISNVNGFTTSSSVAVRHQSNVVPLQMSTMAESGVPPATSEASQTTADAEIPTNLPSDCGMDYIPLATMLATGDLAEADQVGVFSFFPGVSPTTILTFLVSLGDSKYVCMIGCFLQKIILTSFPTFCCF